MNRCNPDVKAFCADRAFCEGTYASEDCYCGRMNRKSKAVTEFVDDVLNAVHNTERDGEYPRWDDFCVELHVPETIATGYSVRIWGEEERGKRYFSIWIFMNDHDDKFAINTLNTGDDDLTAAITVALARQFHNEEETDE